MNFNEVTKAITNPVLKRVAYLCALGFVLFALIGLVGLSFTNPPTFWFGVRGGLASIAIAFITIVIDVLIGGHAEGKEE